MSLSPPPPHEPTTQDTTDDNEPVEPVHMFTLSQWKEHQQRCTKTNAEWLLEELFLQTGENLIGEMGLWTCTTCRRTAYLMVRSNVSAASHRASTPTADDMSTGTSETTDLFGRDRFLGAYFTGCISSPTEEYVGRHPACRQLM